jgi:Beta-lactamase enzyme family
LPATVLVLVVGCGLATTSDVPASPASAAEGHVESGTPGPDAVTAFGAAASVGGTTLTNLTAPVVGAVATSNGLGYWVVAADGGVFASGDAAFEGSAGGTHLNAPIVGMAATPTGRGYWLVASDGGVFAYGDAAFEGSAGGTHLNAPVVGMAATPDGAGYWLVAADGGVFAYGDAVFAGSMGGRPLNQPIVGMAATAVGNGYWMTAADGGIFAFGDAPFEGSMGAEPLNEPIVGMAASPAGDGYWLAAADGGVFNFGDAPFEGSDAGTPPQAPAVGIAGRPGGYWIAYGIDAGARMIPAIAAYVAGRDDNVTVAVEDLTTGQIYQFRPGVAENTASTLKVDILATLLTQAQSAGRPLTPEEQSLAVPMIEESLDSAADTLWTQLGPAAVGAFERAAGMTSTVPATDGVWGTTTTTALDRLAMIRTLVEPNSLLTEASRAYVLDLMENITPSQDWGATGGVTPGGTVALKNGFAVIDGWQINTTGWVNGAGRDYLIAVLTNGNASEQYGIDTVNAVSALVWNALGP